MTGTTLALLLRQSNEPDGEPTGEKEEVHILTKVGPDFAGTTLIEFYRRSGASSRLVLVDDSERTSMAVLPVYQNGKRGCFVNLACNDGFGAEELLGQLDTHFHMDRESSIRPPRAFLFGYPHLLPKMQGNALYSMLGTVRRKLSLGENRCVLMGVDLNGVDGSDPAAAQAALRPALSEIDVLHLNEDEARVLSFSDSAKNESDGTETGVVNVMSSPLLSQIASFHQQGCAVVLLSLGSKGAFVSVTPDVRRLQQLSSASAGSQRMVMSQWTPGVQVHIPAFRVAHGDINANGAGDALFSGFCLAASSWGSVIEKQTCENKQRDDWKITPQVAGTFASLVAWQRCDSKTREGVGMQSASRLMKMIREGNLPETLDE